MNVRTWHTPDGLRIADQPFPVPVCLRPQRFERAVLRCEGLPVRYRAGSVRFPDAARRNQHLPGPTNEDAYLTSFLHVHLERASTSAPIPLEDAVLHAEMFEGMKRVNHDFREVSRLFDPTQVIVHVHGHDTGRFRGAIFGSRTRTSRENGRRMGSRCVASPRLASPRVASRRAEPSRAEPSHPAYSPVALPVRQPRLIVRELERRRTLPLV